MSKKLKRKGSLGGRRMNSKSGKKYDSKRTRWALSGSRHHDQIHEDLKKSITIAEDPELPGSGKCYCVPCARHFISPEALTTHQMSKMHKSRLKRMKEKPHTAEASEAFGGLLPDDKWWKV